MPGITFLGRRLGVGGDEFALPSLCSILLRIAWAGALILILVEAQGAMAGCTGTWVILPYFYSSIACFSIAILADCAIVRLTVLGSITDLQKREGIGRWLLVHFVLCIFQVALAITGLIGVAVFESECVDAPEDTPTSFIRTVLLIVSLSQLADVAVVACCCYCIVGGKTTHMHMGRSADDERTEIPTGISYEMLGSEHIEREWANKCRFLCKALSWATCRVFGGAGTTGADFDHLSRVMARIFHTEEFLDVVPSDIAAGIVLLKVVQRERSRDAELSDIAPWRGGRSGDVEVGWIVPRTMARRAEEHSKWGRVGGKKVVDIEKPDELLLLREGAHFSQYALAIYTWYLYVFDKPWCGACTLCCFGVCGCSRRHHSMRRQRARQSVSGGPQLPAMGPTISGDNGLHLHEAGLLKVIEKLDCELVYAAFGAGLVETPYAVLVDHEWRTVVIAIRGTMSLDDCVTDALAEPHSLEHSGERWGFDGKGMFVHRGIADRAEWIRQDIETRGALKSLLNTGGLGGDATRGYKICVTGHSLGGGVAVVVAQMLKGFYPDLRCVALSPPGGLMDKEHAKSCESFVLSVVTHNDMVPRASIESLEALRDQVLELIGRARVNKHVVMRSMVQRPAPSCDELLYGYTGGVDRGSNIDPAPGTAAYRQQLQRYLSWTRQQAQRRPHSGLKLVVPGRLLHFVKTHKGCYTPIWASVDDFQELVVSSTMFTDHWPTRTVPILRNTVKRLMQEKEIAERAL